MDVAHRRLALVVGLGQGAFEGPDALLEPLHLGLELEDLAHSGQTDTLVGELLDALEQGDVVVGVTPAAALVRLGSMRPLRS